MTPSVDVDTAMSDLDASIARFTSHDGAPDDVGYPRLASAIYDVMDAIDSCERRGIEAQAIRARLAPARQVAALSPLVHRLQTWPRGYPGDFETIERICGSQNLATPGTLAHALEAWALRCAPVQQHRNKVEYQTRLLARAMTRERETGPKIMSVGCGPCWDIREALTICGTSPQLQVVLNDSDQDALDFALAHLALPPHQCMAVCANVLSVVRTHTARQTFDLVLAGGLFDYLDDRQCQFVIRGLYGSLRPGGVFFFTNIGAGNPYRVCMEYLTDWRLIERSEADVRRLCAAAGVPSEHVRISKDSTGLALLVEVGGPNV